MKKILLATLLVAFALVSQAQDNEKKFQRSDIELGIGMTFGASSSAWYQARPGTGPLLKLEYRYNFKKKPIDIGLLITQDAITRKVKYGDEKDTENTSSVFLISNYHFYNHRRLVLYSGVGVGLVEGMWADSYLGGSARVGAKMLRHLNLALEYKLMRKEDAHAALTLGFYF